VDSSGLDQDTRVYVGLRKASFVPVIVTLAHDWPGWVLAPKIQKVMMRLPKGAKVKDRTTTTSFCIATQDYRRGMVIFRHGTDHNDLTAGNEHWRDELLNPLQSSPARRVKKSNSGGR
jgi:hypothetical protein